MLLVLADDFTGALDTGVQFSQMGLKTLVKSDYTVQINQINPLPDVLVLDTESRHLAPQQAYERLYGILQRAQKQGIEHIYKKTDSALRGNVGAELKALSDVYKARICFVPAFPKLGRTTQKGCHYINGVPVHQTEFGCDPFEPVESSYIPDIFQSQANCEVTLIESLDKAEETLMQEKADILVFDAQTQEHMEQIAQLLYQKDAAALCAGCAGFAQVLAQYVAWQKTGLAKPEEKREQKGIVVVSGSLNEITLAQNRHCQTVGFATFTLTPRQKLDDTFAGSLACAALIDQMEAAFRTTGKLLIQVARTREEIRTTQAYAQAMGTDLAGVRQKICQNIGKIAAKVVRRLKGATLSVIGGDTLISILQALGCEDIYPGKEIIPGVVRSTVYGSEGTLDLITKSGGFGEKTLMETLLDRLNIPKGRQVMYGLVKNEAAAGAQLRYDLPIPEISPTQVLVRVRAAAICGTDVHIYKWTPYAQARLKPPMVFGHEFAGDIVKVGSQVARLKVGMRVAGETHIPCNRCPQCLAGKRHICSNMKIIGLQSAGAFCEYIALEQDCAWVLADDLSYEQGALLEPMGVAVHGAFSGEVQHKRALVLGCGPIGLMAVGALKAGGASLVAALDRRQSKLDLARQMGADICIDTTREDFVQRVAEETDHEGMDVILDLTGDVDLIARSFEALKKGGRYTLAGLPNRPLTLDITEQVIYKEARINGVTGREMYKTWWQCSQLLVNKRMDLNQLIAARFCLSEYLQAFDCIAQGTPGKVLLLP